MKLSIFVWICTLVLFTVVLLAVFGVGSLLMIFDQFGWVDLLFVLLNLIPLSLLILGRKEFLKS